MMYRPLLFLFSALCRFEQSAVGMRLRRVGIGVRQAILIGYNSRWTRVMALVCMLSSCSGPIRTDILAGSEPPTPYDSIVQIFGGGCSPENLDIPGFKPPPCGAGTRLSRYFSEISDRYKLSEFLTQYGMVCQQNGTLVECNVERFYDSKPSVWGQPEYPITRNTYRIKVLFKKRDGPYAPSEINTTVRRTSNPV